MFTPWRSALLTAWFLLAPLKLFAQSASDISGRLDFPLIKAAEAKAEQRQRLSKLLRAALLHLQHQEYEAATSAFRLVLQKDPKNLAALNGLGSAWEQAGHLRQASAIYREAHRLYPQSAAVANNLAWTLLRLPERSSDEFQDACQFSLQACQLAPAEPEFLETRAAALAASGELEPALECLTRSIEVWRTRGNSARLAAARELQAAYREHRLPAEDSRRVLADKRPISLPSELLANRDLAACLLNAAELLATHPNATVRSGDLAQQIALAIQDTHGSSPHLLDVLAAVAAEMEHFDEARKLVQQSLALTNDPSEKPRRIAHLKLYEQGLPRRDAGAAESEALATGNPLSKALVLLAASAERSSARRYYRLALIFEPSHPGAHLALGQSAALVGPHTTAEYHLAHRFFVPVPIRPALNLLGAVQEQQERATEARALYAEALRLQPRSPAVANNLAWLLISSEDESQREPERALSLAEAACRATGSTNPEFLETYAATLAADGQFEAALEQLDRAIAIDATRNQKLVLAKRLYAARLAFFGSRDAHRKLALLDFREGRLAAAIERLQALATPEDAAANNLLAAMLEQQGEYELAATHYSRALTARPGWNVAANNLAWLLATQEPFRDSATSTAVELARIACQSDAAPVPAFHETLALTLRADGQLEAARQAEEQARRLRQAYPAEAKSD